MEIMSTDDNLDKILLDFRIESDGAMIGGDADAYRKARTSIVGLLPNRIPPEELPFDENTYEHGFNNAVDLMIKAFEDRYNEEK